MVIAIQGSSASQWARCAALAGFSPSRSAPYVSELHRCSAVEIPCLVNDEASFGSYRLKPGDGSAADDDQRYGFRSGPDGFGFLSLRRDVSEHTIAAEGFLALKVARCGTFPS